MPAGNGVVLVGQGERSNARAVSILARNLFAAGAARLVIGALMPRERAAMHLDTVFTFCDRNVVTIYEPVVSGILPILYTPDGDGGRAGRPSRSARSSTRSATRSGSTDLKVVTTGGDEFEAERNQWDDGNNVVALAPGVVVAYERNEATNVKLSKAGVEVHDDRGPGARPRPRRRPLHDLPDRPRRLRSTAAMSTMIDLRRPPPADPQRLLRRGDPLPARPRRRPQGREEAQGREEQRLPARRSR